MDKTEQLTTIEQEEIDHILCNYPNVVNFFKDIPRDLWDLFQPNGQKEFKLFETNLAYMNYVEKKRNKVMELQRQYELKLRPNESYNRTMTLVRLKVWKAKRKGSNDV